MAGFIMIPMMLAGLIFIIALIYPVIISKPTYQTFEHRWNKIVKPTIGGTFFLIAVIVWAIWSLLVMDSKQDKFHLLSVAIASALAFLVGFIDDRFGTAPFPKLLGQVFVATVLLSGGWILPLSGIPLIDSTFTLIWIVALQNAYNFFDNMDGVAGTVAIILFLFMIFVPIGFIYKFLFLFLSVALLGFLFHNFPPSRIYMGDKGSLLLGTVASITPMLLCQSGCAHLNWIEKFFLFTSFVGLPVIDIILVVIHRLCRKTPPWVGGTDHLSHSFHSLLGSERKVVIIFAILQVLFVASAGISLRFGNFILSVGTVVIWLFMFLVLFVVHWRYVPEPYNSLCYKHTSGKLPPLLRRLLMRCEGRGHPA
ncbi:MAG: undecaprenyl/decaprenyl-phosphate alpha-N-acetylglucosaminyl 1-phosphate transferase [Chlorobi bacterium]|nr:undecaprenyl/decaprenyl-phosphate alpha-N-acetylglucosaminyl 1-phosphate transferase [Chlorobiota bacterium]